MKTERDIGDKEYQVLNSLVRQLKPFNPEQVLLFGSYATANFKQGVSDIDFCVITDTLDKRETLADMYADIQLDLPFDIILYTPEEWARCVQDQYSFAYHISTTGMILLQEFNVMAVPGPQLIVEGDDKIEEFLSVKPNQRTIDKIRKRTELK